MRPASFSQRRLVDEQPRGLDLGRHVRELGLDRLELRDRLAERLALLRVARAPGRARPGRGRRPSRRRRCGRCRGCAGTAEAGAARAEQVLLRHAAVGERERARVGGVPAHLPVGLALLVAGRAVGHDEVRDLLRAVAASPVTAVMETSPGDVGAGVGDELLGAVDHPLAVLQARPRACVAGVRARLRLGQSEGAERLPRAQPRQPLLSSAPRRRTGTPAGCRARCARIA